MIGLGKLGSSIARLLHGAGLVLCATGAVSLRGEDFSSLRNGAYVATVTSSEDELDLDALPGVYQRTPNGEHVTRYATTGHYFSGRARTHHRTPRSAQVAAARRARRGERCDPP